MTTGVGERRARERGRGGRRARRGRARSGGRRSRRARWAVPMAPSANCRYASTSGNSGTTADATVGVVPPEKPHWAHLYKEVVTSGLCTGCAGCIIACPHDVLKYDDQDGVYRPWKVDEDGGPTDCTHGVKGCTMCTRACPAFATGRPRSTPSSSGGTRTTTRWPGSPVTSCWPGRPTPRSSTRGQDGGLVSAILIWALEHDLIDAALVSALEGEGTWKAIPAVARTRDEVLAAAGSRYTYSANTLAYPRAIEAGAERIALVGMSCQASVPAVMTARKTGKVARRLSLSIGLLCSKTFDDAIFPELFEAKYGLERSAITKINIKGVFQIWTQRRRVPRGPAQRGPRLDARGVQGLSGLRRRARRHLHGRHRRLQRLDPHHRPHRPGPRDHRRHGGRRGHRDASRRRRPRRVGAAAQAGPCVAPALARARRPRAGPSLRRAPARPQAGLSHGLRLAAGPGVSSRRLRPARTRARSNTASNIGSVSLPVKVFCWLGWYEHTTLRPSGHGASTPCPNRGRGRSAELVGDDLVGELAEGHHDPRARRAGPARACKKGRQRVALGRCRLVLRRRAAHGGEDVGARAARARRRWPRSSAGWRGPPATARRTASHRSGRR